MSNVIWSVFILIFWTLSCQAQEGIRFSDGSLNAILSIAKDKGKNVFIDTYADWCQPCKRMEKKFKNKEVGQFFNEHFVNYRVNMQNPVKANQLRKRYDIVFLPNMLIVDPNGVVKYQVDRELSISELLNMGHKSLDPNSYHISESTAIRRNSNQAIVVHKNIPRHTVHSLTKKKPEKSVTEEVKTETTAPPLSLSKATRRAKILDSYETVDESSDKILAVLGAGELPPEVLLQEAYLRLEFMDGSHKQAAKNYLATQQNWDTETNRKFILDFAYSTKSEEYEFIIENKDKFNTQFGKEPVKKTLEIITYRALFNAVPRPSLDESIELFKNIDKKGAIRKGYHYYIGRLITEDAITDVLRLGDEFLMTNPKDHEFQYLIARYLTFRDKRTEENLIKAGQLMVKAEQSLPNSLVYLELLGEILSEQGKIEEAKNIYLKAAFEAKKLGIDSKPYEDKSSKLDG